MTYREIISHVARQLGHHGFSQELKADYRYAVKWAENEIMSEIEQVKNSSEIDINESTMSYILPITFHEPTGVVVMDSNNNQLAYEMVTYEDWIKWNPSQEAGIKNDVISPIDNTPAYDTFAARLMNKIVLAIQRESTGVYLFIKPAINGKIQISYTLIPVQDIFGEVSDGGNPPTYTPIVDTSPVIPVQYHHFLIQGAVWYIAGNEIGKALKKNDKEVAYFYKGIRDNAYEMFERRKIKMSGHQDTTTGSTVIRADAWYDKGSKYR